MIKTEVGKMGYSAASNHDDGTFAVNGAQLRRDVGSAGEDTLVATLLEHFRTRGIDLEIVPGDYSKNSENDKAGIDRLLVPAGQTEPKIIVQATMVALTAFLAGATGDSGGRATGNRSAALKAIHDAIVRKQDVERRDETILALDARHTWIYSERDVPDYVAQCGDPATFGFAGIYLIAPTSAQVLALVPFQSS